MLRKEIESVSVTTLNTAGKQNMQVPGARQEGSVRQNNIIRRVLGVVGRSLVVSVLVLCPG